MLKKLLSFSALVLFSGMAALNAKAQSAGTPVYVELRSTIDSNTAKVNDIVHGGLRQTVKLSNGTVLPQGATLSGHVVSVSNQGAKVADGSISIVLDKVILADNTNIPVQATILRIQDAPLSADDTDDNPKDIKPATAVSKLRGVTLTLGTTPEVSGILTSKGKDLRLEYHTLLGCILTVRS